MMSSRIFVVDDEPDIAEVLSDRLQGMGHEVITASDGSAALAALRKEHPALVLLDIQMPKVSGMDVLRCVRKEWPDLPVVVMTAHGTIALAVEAMKEGAADFITKPFESDQLDTVIAKALERKELRDEVGRLLGDISHEVKNLLMPVVCGVGILESELGDLFERMPEMEAVKAEESHKLCDEVIEMLRSTARRLQDRMKEIADYVKSMNAPPHFAPCRIEQVAESVARSLRFPIEQKGIVLSLEGLSTLPTVMADEGRFYNALYNLVNNAIPEVPAGGSITIQGRPDEVSGCIALSVQDTGCGMPPEVSQSLFSTRTISRKAGGTGLGTRIVKDVIDAHGGTITVTSKEGVGTTFQIRLPLRPPGSSSSS
jgi:signal transduction histidine kinase